MTDLTAGVSDDVASTMTASTAAVDHTAADVAEKVDAALGDLDLALDLDLDVGLDLGLDTDLGLGLGAGPDGEPAAHVGATALGTGPADRHVVVEPDLTDLPEVSDLVSSLLLAYARRRGLPVAAAAVAYPLHDPRVAERLVADLARAQGTSEAVVRLAFGQPTPR